MDINTASLDVLQTIPGVGPTLSKRIVASRPFHEHVELLAVPGIGPKRFAILGQHLLPLPAKATGSNTQDRHTSLSPKEAVIPASRSSGTRPSKSYDLHNTTFPLALNHASIEMLQLIRGIGPVLGSRIIHSRPFATVDELQSVRGISTTLLQFFRQHLTVLQSNPGSGIVMLTAPSNATCCLASASFCERVPRCPSTPRLLLATWNIRHLSKHRPTSSLHRIVHVISRFDVVALQEVRDVMVVKRLCALLPGYTYVLSPPLGTTTTEHFCYFYRKSLGFQATVVDSDHKSMARMPFVVQFRGNGPSFVLVNVHVVFGRRHRRLREIQTLHRLLTSLRDCSYDCHVILLGDFNLPPFDIGPLLGGWYPLFRPPDTTTIFNNLYDNIWLPDSISKVARGVVRVDHEFYPDTKHYPSYPITAPCFLVLV
ncbi:hypothetical protein H257_00437 [Aphanomyces astaci]|uniref:Endonuclease/exonuclease/phosphatase domain-containing protein n=1 Tax=Aphanomyces astaci TaxID=112090 RepID=W4HAH7_APHAT|nr:hypothetical protein H257_00437 [Aphanomyces astaci]ETV89035.1 hypothetical protein H257_00437 [Aphanomyces astaci]|eukprot:XP_009821435.1 hypothetical protein H257_00437 [Aphanomyces astaci]